MPLSIRYTFSQRFNVSAKKAFNWCTDYDPKDPELMHEEGVERSVTQITNGSLILKEVFPLPTGQVEKQKLVKLYPEKLMWVSTHIAGPNKHSQFLYIISPKGKNSSVLKFIANHLEYKEGMREEEIRSLTSKLCKDDANTWKLLAKAMTEELKSSR